MEFLLAFKNSVNRALKWLHDDKERRRADEDEDIDLQSKLEKGDVPAMLVSALLVIVPIALAALLILALFGIFFFRH